MKDQDIGLTIIETLEVEGRLWLWLSENPDKRKSEWPEWAFNGGEVPPMHCDCPSCQFSNNSGDDSTCVSCALIELWKDSGAPNMDFCPCLGPDSPYYHWLYTKDPDEKRRFALIIQQGALDKLEKIKRDISV